MRVRRMVNSVSDKKLSSIQNYDSNIKQHKHDEINSYAIPHPDGRIKISNYLRGVLCVYCGWFHWGVLYIGFFDW